MVEPPVFVGNKEEENMVELDIFDEEMLKLKQWLETQVVWSRIVSDQAEEHPVLLDASCPGITYEFEMRPEHEERFNTVVSVLGPMLQHLHKINPLVLASQLISSRPLVWVERYPDNDAMERAIGPLCSRGYCVNDEEYTMRSAYVSGMRQIAKLRRVVALGELSDVTAAVVRGTVSAFGGTQALALLRILPAPQPAWLNRLVHSGEAVAMHSLAANSASDSTAVAGSRITYTVRDMASDGSIAALTQPFEYEVLADFGHDDAGRAIVVRPAHAPRSIFVCFRGVRRATADRAHDADRSAVVASEMERRAWIDALPAPRKRLGDGPRARAGVLRHHEAVWEGPTEGANASTSSSSSTGGGAVDVRAGVDKAGAAPSTHGIASGSSSTDVSVASSSSDVGEMPPSADRGLRDWLARHAWSALKAESSSEEEGELVFVGFSLGGALAQMSALRASTELPPVASHIRVLALGATQWACPRLAASFAERFGGQAVHLLTATQLAPDAEISRVAVGASQRTPPAPLAIPLSAIREHPSPHEPPPGEGPPSPHDGSYGASRNLWTLGEATLVDPMTLGFTEHTSYTHNLILCEAPTEAGSGRQNTSTPPPAGASGGPTPPGTPPPQGRAAIHRVQRPSNDSACSSGSDSGPPTIGGSSGSSLSEASTRAPTLLRRSNGPTLQRRTVGARARTASAARAITQRLEQAPLADAVAAGADARVLALVNSSTARDRTHSSAWPLCGKREGLHSLRRRRPDAGHEHAYHSYWEGSITPQHPFASDVRSLHTGRAYRSALILEHNRLRSWAADDTVAANPTGGGASTLAQLGSSQLPLAMLIDGAWDCHAGVLYQVKAKHGSFDKFEAQPAPGLHGPSIKRLTSISSAMDELELTHELSMY